MGIGEVGELLRRSTVHIRGTSARRQSAGSGVIWDANGTVITNAHVVGSGTYSAELWDGRSVSVEAIAKDDQRDLAQLKVSASGLNAARFRLGSVRPGEAVVAVGNPLGFTGALTTGVVRTVGPLAGLGRRPWVQAAIRLAPGNSGGPLADAEGQVIGINTMVVSNGIALAVPTDAVDAFLRNGAGPRMGVTIQPVQLNGRNSLGLLVLSVEVGSPAEQASFLIGDVLIGTQDAPFTSPADLADAIATANPGGLRVRFLRGDHSREREVVVAFPVRSKPTREAA